MGKNSWNIRCSAAVIAVLILPVAGRGAILLDCGEVKPEAVILHTPEKRGQSARSDLLEQRKALRIDWDCARSGYFEFQLAPGVKLPQFRTAQIRVYAFIPKGSKSRNLNLRIVDRDGETFQFSRPLTAPDSGWQEFVYEIDAGKPNAGSWGGKANRQIDFPAKFTGFASDFNSRTGKGYLGIGTVEIEVLHSGMPLQPQLETGSPLQILTPDQKKVPEISMVNSRREEAGGELFYRVTDAFGAELENATRKITLAPGEKVLFPLMKPEKLGVYYVDVRFRENDPRMEVFEKQFRYCYMQPAGPTPGMAKGFLFGVCSHPQGLSDRNLELEARAAALCGVKIMRTDVYWERIQPTPDRWLFGSFDRVMEAFGAQNIEVQAIYCYLPKWAVAKDWKPLAANVKGKPRPDYDHWRRFIHTFAERYRGRLRYVEVWNEPDHIGFANFPVSEYIEMMKIAYAETKKAAPEMSVLTGGYAGMPGPSPKRKEKDHMTRTLTEGKGFYDVFAFHGHGSMSSYRNQVDQLVKMRRDLGVEAPWYANETAISAILIGEMKQAETLFQKFLYSWANGAIGYNWYDLRNDGFDPNANEHNFGLITKDFQPKAAYAVYNALAGTYREAEFLRPVRFGGSIEAFLFRAVDGRLLLAVWNNDPDSDGVPLCLTGISGRAEEIDLFGNVTSLPVRGNELVFKAGRTPVTIRLEADAAELKGTGELLKSGLLFSVTPGRESEVVPEFCNPTARPLELELKWTPPAGVTLSAAKQKLKLKPGECRKLPLKLAATPEFRSPDNRPAEMKLELELDGLWHGELRYPVHTVVWLETGIPRAPVFVLREAAQVISFAPNVPEKEHLFWKGPADLSAEIRLAHDRQTLLLEAIVTDDVHHQPGSGAEVWCGDNIQMALQLPGQKGMWELGFTRLADGKNETFAWLAPSGFSADKAAGAVRLETSRDEKKKQTVYRAVVPFEAIGLNETVKKSGFRLNLIVNDNDGEMRESCIGIGPGIAEDKDPEHYPIIKFR